MVLVFRSNDYSKNVGINSEWKALLLNKVVVGNGKRLINDDTSLTAPPPGFDSVGILMSVYYKRTNRGLGCSGSGPWRVSKL